MFIAAQFAIEKIWNQSRSPSVDEDVLYIHNRTLHQQEVGIGSEGRTPAQALGYKTQLSQPTASPVGWTPAPISVLLTLP